MPLLGERFNLLRSFNLDNDGSDTGSFPSLDDLLGVKPGEVPRVPHYAPLQGLMTSLYPGGVAVPPLTGGVGIAPTIGQTVTLLPFSYLRRFYFLVEFQANGSHRSALIIALSQEQPNQSISNAYDICLTRRGLMTAQRWNRARVIHYEIPGIA
jgi:hypothetical protein